MWNSSDYKIFTLMLFLHSINYIHTHDDAPQVIRKKQTNTSTATNETRYLVLSPSCEIPNIDPWHETMKGMIEPRKTPVCSHLPPLTTVEGNELVVIQENKRDYNPEGDLRCCYQQIVRPNPEVYGANTDFNYNLSECRPFTDVANLTAEEQFILVKCFSNSSQPVYSNMHARISLGENVGEKMARSPGSDKTSVLMIGIDSVSRLHLMRMMPETVNYLRATGWVEMKGYNKIDDNTFRNMVGVLVGMNISEAQARCYEPQVPLDECPWLFNKFHDLGYVTGYGDDGHGGLFFYDASGFLHPPFDFYLRPFSTAGMKEMPLKWIDDSHVCYGPSLIVDIVFKYILDFTATLKNNNFFGLFWFLSLSHDSMSTTSAMEEPTLKFLTNLTESGVLNNTLVVLFSDHGFRYGATRNTIVGWMEERLPFLYVWVPERYRQLNPTKYSNILINGNRLTSPYDLYLTIEDVLNETNPKGTISCPKCLSLFDSIPSDRSCEDAGIPPHWCTCNEYSTSSTNGSLVNALAEFSIGEINTWLYQGEHWTRTNTRCAELRLSKVLSVRVNESGDQYVVTFEAFPSHAEFEATVKWSPGQMALQGSVSRINRYGDQSECTKDRFLRQYCFCIHE